MRALLMASMVLPITAWADNAPDNVDERTLSAALIERYAADYYPVIKDCYFDYGRAAKTATGELKIEVVIHRDGHVKDVAVEAPGVRGPSLRKLTACIRTEVDDWHFPVRRDFTTAVLPFLFLSVSTPGAGPQYSCWNPRGCHM